MTDGSESGNEKEENNGLNVQTQVGVLVPTTIQAGLNFTLLKTDLMAAFQKKGDKINILVMPTDLEARWVTLEELAKDIMDLTGGDATKGIEEQVGTILPDKVASIKFKISAIYFNYEKTGAESFKEYAFALEFSLEDVDLGLDNFIKLKTGFIGVWNTTNESILSRMNIFKFPERQNAGTA